MKNSIMSTGGRYSTSRMLIDYTSKFYIPLCNLYNTHYTDLAKISEYNDWKNNLYRRKTKFDSKYNGANK